MMGKLVKLWMVLVLVVFLLGVVAPSWASEGDQPSVFSYQEDSNPTPSPLAVEGNQVPQVIVVGGAGGNGDSQSLADLPDWVFILILVMFGLFGVALYLSHNSYPPEFKFVVKDLLAEIQRRGQPLVTATATPLDDWALGMLGKLQLDDIFDSLDDVSPEEARAAALDAIGRLQAARSRG